MNHQSDQFDFSSQLSSLLDHTLVCPIESENEISVPLSAQEEQIFQRLLDILLDAHEKSELTIVYRGEKKQRLRKQFGAKSHFSQRSSFLRLFYLGQKGKFYFYHYDKRHRSRNYLRYINDISYRTFRYIFTRLDRILSMSSYDREPRFSKTKKRTVSKFMKDNSEFTEFFLNKENLPRFVEQVEALNVKEKEQVRDYYLYLLHTFGADGISLLSFFLSSSEELKEAKKFALSRTHRERKAIVIVYFVPKPLREYGVNLSIIQAFNENMGRWGFPVYATDWYPKQKEVAIKGALFPHFILGFHDLEYNYFVVNPHIFEQPEHLLDCVPKDGLIINQENFEEMIRSTSYAGYVERRDGVYSDVLYKI